jgi:Glucose / Sorbosone dehydrogenase
MISRSVHLAIVAVAFSISPLMSSSAPALSLEQVGAFEQPIYVAAYPGDPGRIFVVERVGRIELVENGKADLYVDLSSRVQSGEGERGLASMALAPDFPTSGKLYVAYTTSEDTAEQDIGDIVLDELIEPVDPSSEPFGHRRVLLIPHHEYTFHNGGQLQFGPDGYLYMSTGDGGPGDPYEASQDVESGLGKVLRLDPEPDPPLAYTRPPDNPFAGGSGFAPLIWMQGLRNPFRFSFDWLTGDIAIGDVGEASREEVDWASGSGSGQTGGKAANYGWSCREGALAGIGSTTLGNPSCAGKGASDFDPPVFEYEHVDPKVAGTICSGSIIGGYVVRDPDPQLGALYGRFVYTDYCTGDARTLRPPAVPGGLASDDCSLGLSLAKPASFGEDAAHRIYIASLTGGVYRIAGPPFAGCPASGESEGGEVGEPSASNEASVGATPTGSSPRPRVQMRVRVTHRRDNDRRTRRALIVTSVSPCGGQATRAIQLRLGGKPNGRKVLGKDCRVRFARRVSHTVTFRSKLLPYADEPAVWSASRRVLLAHRRR